MKLSTFINIIPGKKICKRFKSNANAIINKESCDVDDQRVMKHLTLHILVKKQRVTISVTVQKFKDFVPLNQYENKTYYLIDNKNPSVWKRIN